MTWSYLGACVCVCDHMYLAASQQSNDIWKSFLQHHRASRPYLLFYDDLEPLGGKKWAERQRECESEEGRREGEGATLQYFLPCDRRWSSAAWANGHMGVTHLPYRMRQSLSECYTYCGIIVQYVCVSAYSFRQWCWHQTYSQLPVTRTENMYICPR